MNTTQTDSQAIDLPANCRQVFSQQQIDSALDALATRLNRQLAGEKPVVLCVMQGALVFSGQLIPRLSCMLEIDYVHATRYNNGTTGAELAWKAYPVTPLAQRTVLILDDILDEGHTLQAIHAYCESQGASRILSAVLLKKQHDRNIEHPGSLDALADNIALTVADEYVFGFGMDYNGQYRQLPHIYALSGEMS